VEGTGARSLQRYIKKDPKMTEVQYTDADFIVW
jgi:hypothetical protein